MGGSKVSILLSSILMLIVAIWGVSFILTLRDTRHQLAIMGVIITVLIGLTIKPKLPLDGKALIFIVAGYFIAGKGFAYLSPAPPVYVGEIFFALCITGLCIRTKLNLISVYRDNNLNIFIFIACIYGLFRVALIDYKLFGIMALRDSSMIYYSMLATACFVMLRKENLRNSFEKVLPYFIVIGFVSHAIIYRGLAAVNMLNVGGIDAIYKPHADLLVPLTSAFAMMGFHYWSEKKTKGLFMLVCVVAILAIGKTAITFAFILVSLIFLVWGRMRVIFVMGSMAAVLSILIGLTLFSVNSDSLELLEQSDVAGTIDVLGDGGSRGTTAWRLGWWKTVFRDTYNQSPWFGLGLGSDITSNFIRDVMKIEVASHHVLHLTRYPHNILFTVFGRLGFVGLVFFMLYCFVFFRFCLRYCKKFIASKDRHIIDVILLAFVLAGFFNSFVQSTYENPYAGIPHWVFLGAMMTRYHLEKQKQIKGINKNNEIVC